MTIYIEHMQIPTAILTDDKNFHDTQHIKMCFGIFLCCHVILRMLVFKSLRVGPK